jgi:hypothetical protein
MPAKRAAPRRQESGPRRQLDAEIRRLRALGRESTDEGVLARSIAIGDARVRDKLREHVDSGSTVKGSAVVRTELGASTRVVVFHVTPPASGSWLVDRSFAALVDLDAREVVNITDPVPSPSEVTEPEIAEPEVVEGEGVGRPFALAARSAAPDVVAPQEKFAGMLERERAFLRALDIHVAASALRSGSTNCNTPKFGGNPPKMMGAKTDFHDDAGAL